MKINNLDITNFRGLKHLEFSKFGKVNVFLGENNIGKTSILEAIFLLTGMSNSIIPIRMNSFRDAKMKDVPSLKYYFYNANYSNVPSIKGECSNRKKRSIELFPDYGMIQPIDKGSITGFTGSSIDNSTLMGITLKFRNGNSFYQGKIIDGENQVSVNIDSRYLESIKAVFIPSSVKDGNALESYSEIVKRQRKHEFISLMQNFDPRITSVEALSDGLYIQYSGLDELLPISMCGDGTRRFFNIVSFVADPTTDIVMIDEIENGLHYSAYKKMWESILSYVGNTNAQIFVTTHSIETIQCLSEILKKQKNFENDALQVFSLKDGSEGIVDAYPLSVLGLEGAIENNIEIR